MRFCFSCHRITTGEPLFCNHCGRSYDSKLCKRLHPNPRSAEVCSLCGSRELSTPQPRPSLWVRVLLRMITPLIGLFLWVMTICFFFAFIKMLFTDQRLLGPMMALGLIIAIVWLIYIYLPSFAKRGARWVARKTIGTLGKGKQ